MATEPINEEIAGTCVDSYGSAVGMPQLCFEWFPNQILWLVITLVVIFLVLSRIALPRIAAVLAERQGTIDSDISAAETLKRQAEDAEAAYQKALADARAEAQDIAKQTRAAIQKDLDAAIEAEIAPYLQCAPLAVARAKALLRRLGPVIDTAAIEHTIAQLVACWEGPEAPEGIGAFFEKRLPPWQG